MNVISWSPEKNRELKSDVKRIFVLSTLLQRSKAGAFSTKSSIRTRINIRASASSSFSPVEAHDSKTRERQDARNREISRRRGASVDRIFRIERGAASKLSRPPP